jgi:hypothetical protein
MLRHVHLPAMIAAFIGTTLAWGQPTTPATRPANPPTGYGIPNLAPPAPRPDPKPVYKYELKPEHGEFLVIVKTFQGPVAVDELGRARDLAEGLAEYIRSECRLYAYVHESGWAKRQERDKEKAAVLASARKYYESLGWDEERIAAEIKRVVKLARIPDEYSVLVAPGKGTLKNIDEALEFAKYVRKLKAPPADFCDAVMVGSSQDVSQRRGDPQNPFPMAMPGRNPMIARKEVGMQRPKADDFLMSLNSGKPYSLIHKTTRPFTLVVKAYGTQFGQLQKPGEVVAASGRSDGELLERAAQQAQAVATVLRRMKYDAYVLHTRYESFVCIGEYDSKDDANLQAIAKKLAGQPLKDKKTDQVIETFMEQPLPAMIPRP